MSTHALSNYLAARQQIKLWRLIGSEDEDEPPTTTDFTTDYTTDLEGEGFEPTHDNTARDTDDYEEA